MVIVLLKSDVGEHVRQVIEEDMTARQERCMFRCNISMVQLKRMDTRKVLESGVK